MKREVIISALIAALVVAVVGWVVMQYRLRRSLEVMHRQQEEALRQQLTAERERIREDLDEKYRADIVSYEAMAKRLELEKQRVKELEGRLKTER